MNHLFARFMILGATVLLCLSACGAAIAAPLRLTGFTLEEPSAPWSWDGRYTEGDDGIGFVNKQRGLLLVLSEASTDTLVQGLDDFLAYWRRKHAWPAQDVWKVVSQEAHLDSTFGPAVRLDEVHRLMNPKDGTRVQQTMAFRVYLFPHPQSELLCLRVSIVATAHGDQIPQFPHESDLTLLRSIRPRPLARGVDLYRTLPGPTAMAVHENDLWVVCQGLLERPGATPREQALQWNANGTLLRVNATNGQLTASTPVGRVPGSVAVADGSVWVANSADHSVMRLDAASGERQALIKVGLYPKALAADRGALWVGHLVEGNLARIGPGTDSVVVRGVFPGGKPRGTRRDQIGTLGAADSVILSGTEQGQVYATHRERAVTLWKRRLRGAVVGLLPADHTVWIASRSDTLFQVKAATGEVVSRIALEKELVPAGPMAILNGMLFVAMTDGTVHRWQLESGLELGAPWFVGRKPSGMAATDHDVWVVSRDARSLVRITLAGEPVPVPPQPVEVPATRANAPRSRLAWSSEMVVGYHYSDPQRFGITIGHLWYKRGNAEAVFPKGWSVQAELGAAGGGVGVGWCRLLKDPDGPPLIGATLRAKIIQTWGRPVDFKAGETVAGPEATIHFLAARFSLGYLWPLDRSRSGQPDGIAVAGLGVGF